MREDGHSIPIQDIRIIHKMVIARILFLKHFVLVGYEIFMDAEIGRNIGFLIIKMTLVCLSPMPIVSQDMFAKTLIDIPLRMIYPH